MTKYLYGVLYIIVGLITLLNVQSQYFYGLYKKPSDGSLYLGTVHNPSDYFSYLSYMQQGKDNFVSSTDLYTEENVPTNVVRWPFVLAGRLFFALGIGVIEGYQIMVILSLILFLFGSFIASNSLYPKNKEKRFLAFLFFATSTSLPILTFSEKGLNIGNFSYWYNTGNILVRFGPTPHHLLAGFLLLFAFITSMSILSINHGGKYFALLVLPVISLLMTTISPIFWILLTGSFGLTGFTIWIVKRKPRELFYFVPAILSLIGGIPAVIYTRNVFSIPPWNNGLGFERSQQAFVSSSMFIMGGGLVMIFALLGVVLFVKLLIENKKIKEDLGKLFCLYFTILSFLGFYSGISPKLGITNMRFISPPLFFFIGVFAAEGIFWFKKKLFYTAFLAIYIITTLLSYYSLQNKLWNNTGKEDIYVYLPADVTTVFNFARDYIGENSLFLVQPPFHEPFPAITGLRTILGGSDLTINAPEKFADVNSLLSGQLQDKNSLKMLKKHEITHIIAYINNPALAGKPYLKEIYKKGTLVIYRLEN